MAIGALRDGRKAVLAIESGYRESRESWAALLRSLRNRGMNAPKIAIGDGHLGIWAALAEIFPETKDGRCWNHKIRNVLDQLPLKLRPQALEMLRKIPAAEAKAACEKLRDGFVRTYQRGYPKAAAALLRDWDRMVTFYEFRHEHWRHLPTGGPLPESCLHTYGRGLTGAVQFRPRWHDSVTRSGGVAGRAQMGSFAFGGRQR